MTLNVEMNNHISVAEGGDGYALKAFCTEVLVNGVASSSFFPSSASISSIDDEDYSSSCSDSIDNDDRYVSFTIVADNAKPLCHSCSETVRLSRSKMVGLSSCLSSDDSDHYRTRTTNRRKKKQQRNKKNLRWQASSKLISSSSCTRKMHEMDLASSTGVVSPSRWEASSPRSKELQQRPRIPRYRSFEEGPTYSRSTSYGSRSRSGSDSGSGSVMSARMKHAASSVRPRAPRRSNSVEFDDDQAPISMANRFCSAKFDDDHSPAPLSMANRRYETFPSCSSQSYLQSASPSQQSEKSVGLPTLPRRRSSLEITKIEDLVTDDDDDDDDDDYSGHGDTDTFFGEHANEDPRNKETTGSTESIKQTEAVLATAPVLPQYQERVKALHQSQTQKEVQVPTPFQKQTQKQEQAIAQVKEFATRMIGNQEREQQRQQQRQEDCLGRLPRFPQRTSSRSSVRLLQRLDSLTREYPNSTKSSSATTTARNMKAATTAGIQSRSLSSTSYDTNGSIFPDNDNDNDGDRCRPIAFRSMNGRTATITHGKKCGLLPLQHNDSFLIFNNARRSRLAKNNRGQKNRNDDFKSKCNSNGKMDESQIERETSTSACDPQPCSV